MKITKCILILALATLAAPGFSATYYIDFSTGSDANAGTSKSAPWRRAPGMKGFSGTYTHAAGDQFIFKGGVIWDSTMAPWNVSNSGAGGTPDYYGVDKTWYSGPSWTNPIFDGGSQNPVVASPYVYVTGSYVTLDGLQVQNIGLAGTNQGNYALEFYSDHDITVKNMILPVESRIGLYFSGNIASTLSNFTVENNDISKCSWGIAFGTSHAGALMTNVTVANNTIHDFHDQIASNVHGDGIIMYGGGGGDSSQYVLSPVLYGNSFYGDFSQSDVSSAGMTAMIYLDANVSGTALIYNNHGYDTASSGGYFAEETQLVSGLSLSMEIYNNSFAADTSGGFYGFIYPADVLTALVVENNVFTGGTGGYGTIPAAGLSAVTSDYNDFYNQSSSCWINETGGAGCLTYAQFQGQGFEQHGISQPPHFVSAANLFLSPPSPAAGTGVNLASIFMVDADGYPRPATGGWDIGAYQSPAAPTGLTAAAQ